MGITEEFAEWLKSEINSKPELKTDLAALPDKARGDFARKLAISWATKRDVDPRPLVWPSTRKGLLNLTEDQELFVSMLPEQFEILPSLRIAASTYLSRFVREAKVEASIYEEFGEPYTLYDAFTAWLADRQAEETTLPIEHEAE